jgi:hypothetical protein
MHGVGEVPQTKQSQRVRLTATHGHVAGSAAWRTPRAAAIGQRPHCKVTGDKIH